MLGNKIWTLLSCAVISLILFAWFIPDLLDSPLAAQKTQPTQAVPENKTPTAHYGSPTNVPAFDPLSSDYVLLAWADTGMRLYSDPSAKFSLAGPFVTLRAQLVKRAARPEIVKQSVQIVYALEDTQSSGLPEKGPQGLAGRGEMSALGKEFLAQGIPVSPYTAKGEYQPYPLVRVEARDPVSGRVLAQTKAVLALSAKYGCAGCHGGDASLPMLSKETTEKILATHDRLSGSKLAAEAKAAKAVLCVSCHPEEGGSVHLPLSAAIHGFHAQKVKELGDKACEACHPAKAPTLFSRDHHADSGIDCGRCHGAMPEFAASLLQNSPGANNSAKLLATLGERAKSAAPRAAFVNQPDCSGCHDFKQRPGPAASASGKWLKDAAQLYHLRKDESGALSCAACHGAAHATYPCENPLGRDRDNVAPMQYQGFAKALGANGECSVCHMVDMDPALSAHHPILASQGTLPKLPEGFQPTRPRVLFPHPAHAQLDCQKCHHTGYADQGSLSCAQAGCHSKGDPGSGDPLAFRNAFHGPNTSCFACHETQRKAGKPFGPLACSGCHNVK